MEKNDSKRIKKDSESKQEDSLALCLRLIYKRLKEEGILSEDGHVKDIDHDKLVKICQETDDLSENAMRKALDLKPEKIEACGYEGKTVFVERDKVSYCPCCATSFTVEYWGTRHNGEGVCYECATGGNPCECTGSESESESEECPGPGKHGVCPSYWLREYEDHGMKYVCENCGNICCEECVRFRKVYDSGKDTIGGEPFVRSYSQCVHCKDK